jgi:hypothetical protein
MNQTQKDAVLSPKTSGASSSKVISRHSLSWRIISFLCPCLLHEFPT